MIGIAALDTPRRARPTGLGEVGAPLSVDHVVAHLIAGVLEGLPPVGQFFFHFTHLGTQAQKIKTGTETCLVHQTERR